MLGGVFWKERKIIHPFSTDFLITWLQLTLLIRTMRKNSQDPWVSHFRFSVSAYGLKAQTQYFHMMHLWLFITGEVGEEERSLFCYPSRNTVKCLHSQRQLGSFGLGAHIVQAAFVLKSPEGLLKKYFKYSYFFMSLARSSSREIV